MPVQLFVGNLSYQATGAELREHFSAVDPLVSLHLPTDRESGRPRGFAFVEFPEPTQAEEAIRRFNNPAIARETADGQPSACTRTALWRQDAGVGRPISTLHQGGSRARAG